MHADDTSSHAAISTRIVADPPPFHSGVRFAQLGTAATKSREPAPPSIAGDILYGADAIAEFMFGSKNERRAVYNLIQNKRIPHFRIGASVCARRSVLLAWIEGQETGA